MTWNPDDVKQVLYWVGASGLFVLLGPVPLFVLWRMESWRAEGLPKNARRRLTAFRPRWW